MKPIINSRTLKSKFILFLVLFLIPSCETLKEDPLFIGSWQFKDKIYSGDVVINTTHTLKLTKSTFEEVIVYQRDNSSSVMSLVGMKGNISVKGTVITFTLTAFGGCLKDASDKCTSTVEWYSKGSAKYNGYAALGLQEVYAGEADADEDYLWLVRDMNKDSDTEDTWEDIEFEQF